MSKWSKTKNEWKNDQNVTMRLINEGSIIIIKLYLIRLNITLQTKPTSNNIRPEREVIQSK